MSACIIPVAPEFQDPPSQPDPGLKLFNFNPPVGAVVPVPTGGEEFSASVSDGDANDTIYLLWTIDYNAFAPPDVNTYVNRPSPILPPLPAISQPVSLLMGCPLPPNVTTTTNSHGLELIVANRPLTNPTLLDAIDDPSGTVLHGFWTFIANCPVTQ